MSSFQSFWVEKNAEGVKHSIIQRDLEDLPAGEVLIEVHYSSLNYKDALSANGSPGVTKSYPHAPGIDAAGVVVESSVSEFSVADKVIVIGFDLGMNTSGGFGQYIRVPAAWITPLPEGLSLRQSMVIGTAGLTASLCVEKLLQQGASPEQGPVLVSGATGGVGSVAVSLLSKLGFPVLASTGKPDKVKYLESLGAQSVLPRSELEEANKRPMAAPIYANAIDTVGGEILTNIIKSLDYQGSVAICGLVASPVFSTTVLPFILRGVNVLGIDSVELPVLDKTRNWNRLAAEWSLPNLEEMAIDINLAGLSAAIADILAAKVAGRVVVDLRS
ncbi:MAG: YhdH/YhfP family quinone oxidoreductase [Gammaproteobacteria bacterium]|jgi:acrylyl-CoA reductase (NADPH)|nr:YhdH/YhfP family quinone oxidoreductase [Gammaproteobacteria bacterium]MBT5203703.1 YhdH/YhfP family quinone oxidoreductase [Gammaproteobacteria bacterium]MBT5601694.1 YhdH/YhfP family quinone oxidoreductase [Gammaproteobacteria bacterium]MBT6245243.1 YhdH/YhfP family quinone oxidoreductase [Gammaproteobacteria bacterium]